MFVVNARIDVSDDHPLAFDRGLLLMEEISADRGNTPIELRLEEVSGLNVDHLR